MIQFLTVLILTTNTPVPEPLPPRLVERIQQECIRLEILDPRERKYLLNDNRRLAQDFALLRTRYTELVDAPPLCDAERYPTREWLDEQLAFNRRCRRLVREGLYTTEERAALHTCLQAYDRCYEIYSEVRDSKASYVYVSSRRRALKRLRDELLGVEAYYQGGLPNPVPVEYFTIGN